MKHGCVGLALAACVVLCNGVQLESQQAALQTTKATALVGGVDPLNLATCTAGDVTCEAVNLQTKVDYAQSMVEKLTAPITEAKAVLAKVTTAKNDIDGLKTTFLAVKIAVKIASKLPVVGSVFLAIEAIVQAMANGIETLAKSIKSVHSTLISPWETAVGSIENSFVGLPDTLFSIVESVAAAAAALPQMCLKDTLSTFLPSVESALNSVGGAVGPLLTKMDTLIAKLDATWTAVSTGLWVQAKATLDTLINRLDVVSKAANALKPLSNALTKTITIPWIGEVRDRARRNRDHCPAGMQPKDLFCHSGCGAGMEITGLDGALTGNAYKCMSKCDTGTFETHGFKVCHNPGELTPAGMPYTTPICHGCHHGDSLNGWGPCDPFKTCSPSCKDGKVGLGNGYCTKACTTGGAAKFFGIPPDLGVNVCTVKVEDYTGKLVAVTCKPGYTWDFGYCRENCRNGEIATWDFCIGKAQKSFTIKDVMEEVRKILSVVEKLPLYTEIKNAIGSLAQSALSEVTKAIQGLNLPTAENLPSISVNFATIDALPVAALQTAITDILALPAGVNLGNVAKFPAQLEAMVSSLISKAKLPTDWAGCRDMQCFTKAMGVPPEIDFSRITQTLTSLQGVLEEIWSAGLSQSLKCAESQTVSVPLTTTLASVLGLPTSQVKPCDLSIDICTKPEIDQQALNDAMAQKISAFKPLMELMHSLRTQEASLLQQGTNLRHGRQTAFFANEWIPVLLFNSYPLVSSLDFSSRRFPTPTSHLFRSKPGSPGGTFVRVRPMVNILVFMKLVDENGRLGMQMRGSTVVSVRTELWKGTEPREILMHALRTLDEELAELNTQKHRCLQSVYPATKGEGPTTQRTAFVYNIADLNICKKIKRSVETLQNINKWKQKTIGGKPVDEAAIISGSNAFWNRGDVKEDVAKLVSFLMTTLSDFVFFRKSARHRDIVSRWVGTKLSDVKIPISIGFENGVPSLLTLGSKGWFVGPLVASAKHQLDFAATFSTETGDIHRATLWLPSKNSFRHQVADKGWSSGIFDKSDPRLGFGVKITYLGHFFDSAVHTFPTSSPTQIPTVAPTTNPTPAPVRSPTNAPITSPPTFPGLHIVSGTNQVGVLQPRDFISCETELYLTQAPSTWAMVLRVGNTWETRVPSVYLTPWSAKIQTRTSTLEHWNYAVTGPALALRTRHAIKVYIWDRYHVITLGGKIVAFELNRKGMVQVRAPHGLFEGSPQLKGQMSTPVCDLQPLRPLVNQVLQTNVNLGPNIRCFGTFQVNAPLPNLVRVFRMRNKAGDYPFIIWATHDKIRIVMGNANKPWGLYSCTTSINLSVPTTISLSIRGRDVLLEKFTIPLCKATLPQLPFDMNSVTILEGSPLNPPVNIMTRDFVCLPQ